MHRAGLVHVKLNNTLYSPSENNNGINNGIINAIF